MGSASFGLAGGGLFLLVFGLYYGGRAIYEERIRRQLRQGGPQKKAVVTSHRAKLMGRGWYIYYVQYRYHHQGQSYEREERVSSDRSNVWPKGTFIPICCLPQNPSVARITSEKNPFLALGVGLIVPGIILLVVAIIFMLTL